MLKKLSAFAFLGVLAALTLSAFSSVGSLPVTRFGFSLGFSEFNLALPSNSAVPDGGTNFRIAHTFNGYFIPSVNVTSVLDRLSAVSGDETNFRIAHIWNGRFIPSVDVTGVLDNAAAALNRISPTGVPRQYEYGPALRATGFLGIQRQYEYGPALRATGFLGIQRQYEYGPALRATGFAAKLPQPASAPLKVIARQYQYGPFSLATGFAALAPHRLLFSGH